MPAPHPTPSGDGRGAVTPCIWVVDDEASVREWHARVSGAGENVVEDID